MPIYLLGDNDTGVFVARTLIWWQIKSESIYCSLAKNCDRIYHLCRMLLCQQQRSNTLSSCIVLLCVYTVCLLNIYRTRLLLRGSPHPPSGQMAEAGLTSSPTPLGHRTILSLWHNEWIEGQHDPVQVNQNRNITLQHAGGDQDTEISFLWFTGSEDGRLKSAGSTMWRACNRA